MSLSCNSSPCIATLADNVAWLADACRNRGSTYAAPFGSAVLSRNGYAIKEYNIITLCSSPPSTSPPSSSPFSNSAGASQVQLALPRNATSHDDDEDDADDLANRWTVHGRTWCLSRSAPSHHHRHHHEHDHNHDYDILEQGSTDEGRNNCTALRR